MQPAIDLLPSFVGGFVAAEGTFIHDGRRFTFAIGLGARDRCACELLRSFFGCGTVTESPRRRPHYDDEVTFAIRSLPDHIGVTIPFMDEHLPVSYKRVQYLAWREALVDYWEHGARRVRECSVAGCLEPRRAHGLCRRHLYLERGV